MDTRAKETGHWTQGWCWQKYQGPHKLVSSWKAGNQLMRSFILFRLGGVNFRLLFLIFLRTLIMLQLDHPVLYILQWNQSQEIGQDKDTRAAEMDHWTRGWCGYFSWRQINSISDIYSNGFDVVCYVFSSQYIYLNYLPICIYWS